MLSRQAVLAWLEVHRPQALRVSVLTTKVFHSPTTEFPVVHLFPWLSEETQWQAGDVFTYLSLKFGPEGESVAGSQCSS
jgi:hypothetical protein